MCAVIPLSETATWFLTPNIAVNNVRKKAKDTKDLITIFLFSSAASEIKEIINEIAEIIHAANNIPVPQPNVVLTETSLFNIIKKESI